MAFWNPTAISSFWNVMFALLVLILINLLLKKFLRRHASTQGEFITIYAMLCMASAFAGHDSLQLGKYFQEAWELDGILNCKILYLLKSSFVSSANGFGLCEVPKAFG